MRGDLHLHSAYSDGSATVIELIQQAVSKGLTHIAITDHDRVPRCGHCFEGDAWNRDFGL